MRIIAGRERERERLLSLLVERERKRERRNIAGPVKNDAVETRMDMW